MISILEEVRANPELAVYLRMRRVLVSQLKNCNTTECSNIIAATLLKLKNQYLKTAVADTIGATPVTESINDEAALELSTNIANPTLSSKAKVYGYMCAAFDGEDNKKCMIDVAKKLLLDLNTMSPEDPGIPESAEYLTNYVAQLEAPVADGVV